MPAWIHSRAEHLLAKNPSMSKSTAFALATQQSHAAGKTPKGYGTTEGRQEAKAKFDKPKKEYVKTPNPGGLDSPKLKGKPKTKESEVYGSQEGLTSKFLKMQDRWGRAKVRNVLNIMATGPYKYSSAGAGALAAMREELQKQATEQRDNPYLLDKISIEPKVPQLRADAPEPKFRVKVGAKMPGVFGMPTQVGQAGFNPAKQLAQSQKIGVPKLEQPKMQTMGVKMASLMERFKPDPAWLEGFLDAGRRNAAALAGMRKAAFQVSQFSGTLGGGPRDIYTPSDMKYGGEAGEDSKGKKTKVKVGSMLDELTKLNATATTPAGRLHQAQLVGAPKSTPPPGPSISQLSKPVGYGMKAPGAVKGSI